MEVIKTIENKIVLTDDIVYLDKFVKNAVVTVNGSCTLNAINLHNNLNLKIKLERNSSLILNIFDYAVVNEVKIDVLLKSDTSFILNDAFIADEKYALNVDTKLDGINTCVFVNVRGINEEAATSTVIMNGTVGKKANNSTMNEYAKIINKSENSAVLIPNLIVDANEIEANHGVSIGSVDEDEIFYLLSKGISRDYAIKMIENGFLLSIMSDEIKEKIRNILVGR